MFIFLGGRGQNGRDFHKAFILVDSDVKRTHVSFNKQKSYLYPQHLGVVILECAARGMLPIGLMWSDRTHHRSSQAMVSQCYTVVQTQAKVDSRIWSLVATKKGIFCEILCKVRVVALICTVAILPRQPLLVTPRMATLSSVQVRISLIICIINSTHFTQCKK